MGDSTHRPPGRALALAALVALAFGGAARAEPADAATPERLTALRYEWHKQNARKEAADWEINLVAASSPGSGSVGQFQDATPLVNELRNPLTTDYTAFNDKAKKLAEQSRERLDAVKKDWDEVCKQRVAFRRYAEEEQAAHGFNLATGALPALRPTLPDAAVLVWAVVVLAVAVRLGRRVRRVALRRARRFAGAAALFALFAASGCSYGPAPAGDGAAREETELVAGTEAARAAADASTAAADAKGAAAVEAWAKLVASRGAPGSLEPIVRTGEADARARLRSAATDARLADRLATEAATDQAQLATDRAKLGDLKSAARWRLVAFTVARCLAAALLFGLAVLPYWRAVRKEAAAVKADARKCPRCFSERLVVEKTGTIPGAEEAVEASTATRPRYRAGKKAPAAPTPRTPTPPAGPAETGYVECKACGFRFLRSYLRVRRLCFPAVGVRNSGKTHLLATAYDKVRKQTAPTAATAVPAPSLGDERFDQYIDLILNLKRDAGNTLHAMPDPVMLHVRDADPSGGSAALVNLFDYSGELLNDRIDTKGLRKQAVRMDGFMLFLDPTQLDGRAGGVTLDRQLADLNVFLADMREARGVGVGEVIPVPVAVVVPKFDLLVKRNPIGGQSVPFIRRLLDPLTPPRPKQTTLELVRERSELVEDMLELMFRGVNVRALVESYFGPRVLFFPVSSVSLFENELGVEDLGKRTIAPYGVAEPFLWLLHMHGYQVFAG